jgi:aminopeptidase N
MQDVNALMSPWTQQMGFPVITVREEKGEDGLRTLHISQRLFIADGSDDEKALLWPVPINISTAGEPMHIKEKILLKEREMTIQLKDIPQGDWIKVRAGIYILMNPLGHILTLESLSSLS